MTLKHINPFVIFAHARSGSSALYEIMCWNKRPILFEPFNTEHYQYKNLIENYQHENLIKYHQYENIIEYHQYKNAIELKRFKNIISEIFSKSYGIKHLFNQLTEDKNKFLIEKFPCIFLYRKDITSAALSFELSIKTKIWTSEGVNFEENYIEDIKNDKGDLFFLIDPESLQETINSYSEEIKLYRKNIKNGYVIEYENLFGPDGFDYVKEIMNFLNIKITNEKKTIEILRPIRKLNKKPWEEVITNWEEISKIIEVNKNKIKL